MDVVFMGTPAFAVPTLQKLYENNFNIKLVVTQPDKPFGRGKKIKESEVKQKAKEFNIPVYQPEKIKNQESINFLRELNPDVIVVVAYGQILSKEILELPKYGCINVHASLLPSLRGAAPINYAIINGLLKTGITTMKMDIGLDTGDMLLKKETIINEDMNYGQLHDILMEDGANLLIETLKKLESDELQPIKQDSAHSSYAPLFTKSDCKIKWNSNAKDIHNLIRGLSPFPTAFFKLDGKIVKVYKASYLTKEPEYEVGYVIKAESDGIYVQAEDGIVIIQELQLEGKNRMDVSTFLRGNKFLDKIILE